MDDTPVTSADDAIDRAGLRVAPMTPAHAAPLVRFHETLTPRTTRSRFFAVHPHLSVAEIERFTDVDHEDREALVVLDADGELVAVARFDRLAPGAAIAEVAFVVADAWQHRGLGAALFARLARRAATMGITCFRADTLVENQAMRAVFRHAGYPVVEVFADGIVRVTIDLAAA
jgi:RimJ/RimL family protein N-acetyltransferase